MASKLSNLIMRVACAKNSAFTTKIFRRHRSSSLPPSLHLLASTTLADSDITDMINLATRKHDSSEDDKQEMEQKIARDWVNSITLPIMPQYDIYEQEVPKEGFCELLTEGTSLICNRLPRKWEQVQDCTFRGTQMRVCSYNVLCQKTISRTPFLYEHLLSGRGRGQELSWAYRSTLLARELEMIQADIFCLQEVQHDHYEEFYEPVLKSIGYKGLYKKRTGQMVDGCAIFFRSHLQLMSCRDIEYFFGRNHNHLNKDNVGQVARFRDMNTGTVFCVANTHLVFNKRMGDVKLAQAAYLLANLHEACSCDRCPYIVCGDFNMQPYSPLYNFLTNGWLSFSQLKKFDVSGQGETGGVIVSPNIIPPEINIGRNCRFNGNKAVDTKEDVSKINAWSHNMKFMSAYSHQTLDQKPEVSAFQSVEASNPDFIFYSVHSKKPKKVNGQLVVEVQEGGLHLLRRLTLPSEPVLRSTLGPWPHSTTPSDHIPLIADFILE